MQVLIYISQTYAVVLFIFLLIYLIRHFMFTFNRMYAEQKNYYHDIIDDEWPYLTVILPMHNEEEVARVILDRLIDSDYPKDKLEIIPIDDHSDDKTGDILQSYALGYDYINPYHRGADEQKRGKAASLNEVMAFCKGEIIVVFDADYEPPKGILRALVVGFKDPEIGAVMGRVLVKNTDKNLLTMMLDMERSGGYQVGQQARYNLDLFPQYGGTVGAYRHEVLVKMDGFDPKILAEDTELTFKMFLHGWKVAYANKAECYEEAPESWQGRANQVRRWSRGHNQVMYRYFVPLLTSQYLSVRQKIDGLKLLFVYILPFALFLGILNSLFLFFVDEMTLVNSLAALMIILAMNAFGNFAPFFQLAMANFIDGRSASLKLIPVFAFNFVLYMYYASLGFIDSLIDLVSQRNVNWVKTPRQNGGRSHE